MYKGVLGFSVWFYGAVALLLAVCKQPMLLGGLMGFVFLVEKDEWLNRQIMQAFLLCLFSMALQVVIAICMSLFMIIPLFGCWVSGSLSVVAEVCIQLFVIFFAVRAFDRIHKGLDSDIPVIAGFVNTMF